MKVTLSPTNDQQFEKYPHNTVSLESPHDDINIEDAMRLVTSALVAWGYSPQNVAEYLDVEFARNYLGIKLEGKEYMPKFEGDPDDCKFEEGEAEKMLGKGSVTPFTSTPESTYDKTLRKFLGYRTDEESGVEYVTYKQIENKFGTTWAQKFSKAMGEGNTMIMVEEDGKQVGGICTEDWERFRDVVDENKETYFD